VEDLGEAVGGPVLVLALLYLVLADEDHSSSIVLAAVLDNLIAGGVHKGLIVLVLRDIQDNLAASGSRSMADSLLDNHHTADSAEDTLLLVGSVEDSKARVGKAEHSHRVVDLVDILQVAGREKGYCPSVHLFLWEAGPMVAVLEGTVVEAVAEAADPGEGIRMDFG